MTETVEKSTERALRKLNNENRKRDSLIADIEKDIAHNKANNLPVKDLESKLTSELATKATAEAAVNSTTPSFSKKAMAIEWWNSLNTAQKAGIIGAGTLITVGGIGYTMSADGKLEARK